MKGEKNKPNAESLRRRLVEKLEKRPARLTPERAEAIADRIGAAPLNPRPRPDPMRASHWTTLQAVAWIMTRDASKVQRCSWEPDAFDWQAFDEDGRVRYRLDGANEPRKNTLVDIRARAVFEGGDASKIPNADDAFSELANRLASAKATVTGVRDGELTEITPAIWVRATLGESGDLKIPNVGSVSDVRIERAEILREWPAPGAAVKRAAASSAAEKRAVAALATRLKADREMKRGDAATFCETEHGIGPTAFKARVWPQAREMAGLPRHAASGRPRNENR